MTDNSPCILLIEDDPNDRELTLRALKESNYDDKTFVAKDGEEGIDFIFGEGNYADRKGKDYPKLILLDLNLPKIHGLEVLKKIKAEEKTKNIPIIVLTSSKDDIVVKECFKQGVDNYVIKTADYSTYALSLTERVLFWLEPE